MALSAQLSLLRSAQAAPSKDQCVDSYTRAQDLRRSKKLLGAREALLVCADDACPKLVRVDCVNALSELNALLPSIVFEAKDGAGKDLSEVKVTSDGQPLVDRLDGSALELDPGPHSFTFETSSGTTRLDLVIREGERGRRERVTIGAAPTPVPAVPAAAASPKSEPPAPEQSRGIGPQRTAALVSGGVGVAGVIVGSVFGVLAINRKNDAEKSCPDVCPDQPSVDKWNSAQQAGNVSTVAFIVGGVGLAAGAVLWFTAKPETSASVGLGVGPGALQLRGRF
ncbi:MAG TPA: hypothetical protein VFK05_10845 [Polyangiaceae bacterium]|nr:hypothetical protein [Polyangiaceae bacterium]